MNLKKIFSEITKNLNELDQKREDILKISRAMIRNCSVAIKSIHRKEFTVYQEKINEIKKQHQTLLHTVKEDPALFDKYLKTPEQEFMEAVCLFTIINDQDLPNPADYSINQIHYLLGLADVIGELRRYILDKIRRNEVENIEKILERMVEIQSNLFSLDYPKGLIHDLRHKVDVARSIIEKTRGDVSLSMQINRLNQNLKKE